MSMYESGVPHDELKRYQLLHNPSHEEIAIYFGEFTVNPHDKPGMFTQEGLKRMRWVFNIAYGDGRRMTKNNPMYGWSWMPADVPYWHPAGDCPLGIRVAQKEV